MRQLLKSALAAALALVGAGAVPCFASGGDPTSLPVTAPRGRPEQAALADFLDGRLGVLWPSYDRAFLLIAYRVVHGLAPLSEADAARLRNPAAASTPYFDPQADAQKSWLAARAQLQTASPGYELSGGWRTLGDYSYGANCEADAFRTAARTLQARAAAHAQASAALQHWISAQDSVFSQCNRSNQGQPLPPLPDAAPQWLVQDQAYQQAASLFYQEKLDEAAAAFAAIAADPASPWREWAGYLQVRAWWRSTFRQPDDYRTFAAATPDWAQHAHMLSLKRLATSGDSEVAAAAQQLHDALSTRFAPRSTLQRLWGEAAAKTAPADLRRWVDDLRFTWAVATSSDIGDDWLHATRSLQPEYGDSENLAAVERLRAQWKTRQDPLILASLLMALTPQSPDTEVLVEASRALKPGHPLYLHCAWQRIRLAIAADRPAAARSELEAVAALLPQESLGTRQHFDQLSMLAASDLATLGKHLIRVPVAEETTEYIVESWPIPADQATRRLDEDTQQWLAGQLTGQDLLHLARAADMPDEARQQLVGEAWMQGIFLPDQELELAAARLLAEQRQQPAVIEAVQKGNLAELRFLTAQWLLDGNSLPRLGARYGFLAYGFLPPPPAQLTPASHWQTGPAFYDSTAREQRREARILLAKANSTTWMGQHILPWISAHPELPQAPGLLRELVYASRYFAKDTPTSRRAFQLLHKLYPDSEEAKTTKYYY